MNTNQAATRRAITKQLLTNTGRSMMDSGGSPKYDEHGKYIGSEHGYGRNHERNRDGGVRFGQGPTFDSAGATIPVQDYMEHCFARTPRAQAMERELKRRLRKMDPEAIPDYYYRDNVREVLEAMGCDADGEHNWWKWWNTYNDETDLGGTLQLVTFRRGDTDFAIVQVHGGCDVRGGYTDGTLYEVPERYNMYDVRAEVEGEDGNGPDSLYCAQKNGLTWNAERGLHVWPSGEPASWNIPALEYYGHPQDATDKGEALALAQAQGWA